jgi:uncharacterized protein YcfL
MKSTKIIEFALLASLIIVSCKSKQTNAEKNTTTKIETGVTADNLLEVATLKFPGITQNDLEEGRTIFNTACVSCHSYEKPTSRTEEKWVHILDEMAPKAKLDANQKKKVLEYVLSTRADQLAKKNK